MELPAYLFRGSPFQQYAFLTTPRSAQDMDGTYRQVTDAGEKSAQLIVRGTVGRRCRHADLYGMTMHPCAFSTGSFRLDMD